MRNAVASVCLVACCSWAASAAAAIDSPTGIWLGTLDVGAVKLRIAFHVTKKPDGALSATMDSLDQSARGVPCDTVEYKAPMLRIEIAKMALRLDGKLAGDSLEGTFTQGKSFPFAMKRVQSLEGPKRPQMPKRPFPYREEEVTVTVAEHYGPQRASRSIKLAGTLTLPEGKGPFPAVVFVTGSGPEDRDETVFDHKPFLIMSDALTRAGIVTLRCDDRGTGKSESSLAGLTTLDFAQDTQAQLELLASRAEVDKRRIGVVGHSEGGLVAPIVATQSKLVSFIVSLAGTGTSGVEIMRKQIPAAMKSMGVDDAVIARAMANSEKIWAILVREPDPAKVPLQVKAALAGDPKAFDEALPSLRPASLPWLRTFLSLEPANYWKQVKVPVLALNGALDLQVDPSNLKAIERALKSGGNKQVTVAEMPGLNHLFQHAKTGAVTEYATIEETCAPEVLAKIIAFIGGLGGR